LKGWEEFARTIPNNYLGGRGGQGKKKRDRVKGGRLKKGENYTTARSPDGER